MCLSVCVCVCLSVCLCVSVCICVSVPVCVFSSLRTEFTYSLNCAQQEAVFVSRLLDFAVVVLVEDCVCGMQAPSLKPVLNWANVCSRT